MTSPKKFKKSVIIIIITIEQGGMGEKWSGEALGGCN